MKTKMILVLISLVLIMSCRKTTNVEAFIKDKNVFVTKSDGTIQQVTFMGKDIDAIISPEKMEIYFIRESGNFGEYEYKDLQQLAIMKVNLTDLREVKLTDTIYYEDFKRRSEIFRVNNFSLSNDGKFLFFLTQKWMVTDVLVRLSTDSYTMTEINHGDKFEILRDGKYKNHIIVYRIVYKNNAGRQYTNWLIDFNGNQIKELGGDESVNAFKKTGILN